MALYEIRTYTLYVGKMAEATRLYQEFGFPAIKKAGFDKYLIGYFLADSGTINQIIHMWKFADDADRRYADKDFMDGFRVKFHPLVMSQEVKVVGSAPWGHHP